MTSDDRSFDGLGPLGGDDSRSDEIGHIDRWESLALDLLAGALTPEEAAPLEAHLTACPTCRAAMEEQASLAAMIRSTQMVAVPDAIGAAVLEALELPSAPPDAGNESRLLESIRRFFAPRVWLPAAAMVLVVGVAISSYYRTEPSEQGDAASAPAADSQKDATSSERAASAESGSSSTLSQDDGDEGSLTAEAGIPTTTTMSQMSAGSGQDVSPEMLAQLNALVAESAVDPPIAWLTVGVPSDNQAATAQRIEETTGLKPLPSEAWVGGMTTYAAWLTATNAALLARDLAAVSAEVTTFAAGEPAAPAALADMMVAGTAELPVLTPESEDPSSPAGWRPTYQTPAQTAIAEELVLMVLTLGATD